MASDLSSEKDRIKIQWIASVKCERKTSQPGILYLTKKYVSKIKNKGIFKLWKLREFGVNKISQKRR